MASSLVGAGVARLARLGPLSREGSTAMLAERSGRAVSGAAAAKAWELCAGNPLLLEQVALAIGRGAIDAEAAESWPALEPNGLLLSRFAGLPKAALRCVRAASVLGVRFRLDVAAEVAVLAEIDADRAVEALCRSGLVEQTTPGQVRFVHPLFAQALYDDLPGPMRARLHARSFEVLARRGLDAEAAEHALRAGLLDDPEVIAALERAGRAALDVGALETAAAQLTTAVGLAGKHVATPLLLAQAEALLGAGDPIAASLSYERVLSQRRNRRRRAGGGAADEGSSALRQRRPRHRRGVLHGRGGSAPRRRSAGGGRSTGRPSTEHAHRAGSPGLSPAGQTGDRTRRGRRGPDAPPAGRCGARVLDRHGR